MALQNGLKAVGHFLGSSYLEIWCASWDGKLQLSFSCSKQTTCRFAALEVLLSQYDCLNAPTDPIDEKPSYASPRCGVEAESSCRGKNLNVTFLPQAAPVLLVHKYNMRMANNKYTTRGCEGMQCSENNFFMLQAAPTHHKQNACFTHTCIR